MSPSSIEVLLHCHCSPLPHPRIDVLSVQKDIQELFVKGLILPTTEVDRAVYEQGAYKTTERGAAHIAQLCQVPYPELRWIGFDGGIITHTNGEKKI